MKKDYTVWRLMAGYVLILVLMLISNTANGQSPCENEGLCIAQFNACFNEGNKVIWLDKLSDCENTFIDIQTDTKAASTYKIVVVPTLVIFFDGEEVGRFQANIMMKLEATQEEVQGKIDEILMDSF